MTDPISPTDAAGLAYDRLQGQYQFLAGFLGTASHELRAPINQIVSLHQLILEDLCEGRAEEREFIAQANQAITRVLQNLDLLIRLSKLEIGALQPQRQPISLPDLLAEVEQLTTMKCTNRHCRLQVSPTPKPETVYGDPQWLRQVLVLLVDGALAAGSRQLEIGGEPQGLCLRSDSPWPTTATPAVEAAQPAQGFSPGFYYQVAARMAAALQLTLTLTEGDQVIHLQWPPT